MSLFNTRILQCVFLGCFLTFAFLSCNPNRSEVFHTVVVMKYEPSHERKAVSLGCAAACNRSNTPGFWNDSVTCKWSEWI